MTMRVAFLDSFHRLLVRLMVTSPAALYFTPGKHETVRSTEVRLSSQLKSRCRKEQNSAHRQCGERVVYQVTQTCTYKVRREAQKSAVTEGPERKGRGPKLHFISRANLHPCAGYVQVVDCKIWFQNWGLLPKSVLGFSGLDIGMVHGYHLISWHCGNWKERLLSCGIWVGAFQSLPPHTLCCLHGHASLPGKAATGSRSLSCTRTRRCQPQLATSWKLYILGKLAKNVNDPGAY